MITGQDVLEGVKMATTTPGPAPSFLRGVNWIEINAATMKAVLQAWLDQELRSSVTVTDIKCDQAADTFMIRLAEPERG